MTDRAFQMIYTIAVETRECYGHGDSGTEQRIIRTGPYGNGSFPPAFSSRERAERYLRENADLFHGRGQIVQTLLFHEN